MKTATQTKIDDAMASQYLNRHTSGSPTGRLLVMAEEQDSLGNAGAAKILRKAAQEMAKWELEQE